MKYISNAEEMKALTLEEAKKALENGVKICYVNSFPEYHGSHADEYMVHTIKTEKELENVYQTFGNGIEHKAYLDPVYGNSPDLDKIIENNILIKTEEQMLKKVATIYEFEKQLGGEKNPDTLTEYYEELGIPTIKSEVYQSYDMEDLIDVINEAYQDIVERSRHENLVDEDFIKKDIERAGFKPTESLLKKMKDLNAEGEYTLKDVQQIYFKNVPANPEVQSLVSDIANECLKQELVMQKSIPLNPVNQLSLGIEM